MRLLRSLLRRWRDARAYRQLAKLPDHRLEDLGISRAQVEALVRRPLWSSRRAARGAAP